MTHFRNLSFALAVAGALSFPQQANATITITTGTTYQTFEGIGAMDGVPSLYVPAGPFYGSRSTQYEYDQQCIDLGFTAFRFPMEECFASSTGYDWSALSPDLAIMREYLKRGVNRFLVTPWSPPGWMKDNNSVGNGGSLIASNNQTYANYLAAYCKAIKDSIGIEPYAIAMQNEPAFAEPYASCIMGDAQMNTLVTLAAQAIAAIPGLKTEVVGPEEVDGFNAYSTTKANANLWAFVVHNGFGEDAGGKPLWMDEWDDQGLATTNYMNHGQDIINALNSHNLTWWTWFGNSDIYSTTKNAVGLDTSCLPNGYAYASKHIGRFVRPYAVRIGCTVSDAGVIATAFRNTDGTIAIVVAATNATIVDLAAGTATTLPATWQVYQSTGSGTAAPAYCVYKGTTNGTGISLPASSMTSLTSGSQIPALGPDTTRNSLAPPTPDATVGQMNYDADDKNPSRHVYLNGTLLTTLGPATTGFSLNSTKGDVAIRAGTNVVAAYLFNNRWGSGIICGMILPPGNQAGDTLRSDGTWKVTIKQPDSATWTSAAFDDSKWASAWALGPVTMYPGFASWGMSAVNLYYLKSQWITGARHCYMRKEVTLTSGDLPVFVTGCDVDYQIYVDGALKLTGTPTYGTRTQTVLTGMTAGTHCIGIALTDAVADGNGVLFKFQCTNKFLDTTWKCWTDTMSAAGWSTIGFVDTAWVHPVANTAYDGSAMAGSFIYPGHFWFRKVFASTQSGIVSSVARNQVLKASKVSYYTLMGRKLTSAQIPHSHNGIVVQKIEHGNSQATFKAKAMIE